MGENGTMCPFGFALNVLVLRRNWTVSALNIALLSYCVVRV